MFNSEFSQDQIGNVVEGSAVCSYAHYIADGEDIPHVQNRAGNIMPVRARRQHVGGAAPGCIVWRDDDLRVVAIAGAREPADQRQIIPGWGVPMLFEQISGRFNPIALTWANSVGAFLFNDLQAARVPTWFFGFSWGGSAACIMAKLVRMSFVGAVATAVTYGTPRFCDHQAAGAFDGTIVCRLFNNTDPIVFLPPQLSEAPFANACAGPFAAPNWNTFRHVTGGVGMTPSGTLFPATLPNGVPLPLDTNIYDFVRLNIGEGRPHSIMTYRRILETAFPETRDEVTDPGAFIDEVSGGHGSVEKAGHVPTRREFVNNRHGSIDARARNAPTDEVARLRREGRRLITIKKEQGGWSVFIGQDRVYEATSKRDARGVANALRALAVQYDQQPDLWARSDVLDIMQQYLQP